MVFKLLGLTLIRFRLMVFLWYICFYVMGMLRVLFFKKHYKQYMHLSITLDGNTFLFRLSQSVSDHQGHWCEFWCYFML
jgi:hypothetical protein